MGRFLESGVVGLSDRPQKGRPRIYVKDVDTELIRVAAAPPKDLGLPFTTWSLPKLQEYLDHQPGLEGVTR